MVDAVDPQEIESLFELRFLKTDSVRWHSTAARRARDGRKTAYLESLGLIVVRLTWHELHEDPAGVYARILAAFDRSNRT